MQQDRYQSWCDLGQDWTYLNACKNLSWCDLGIASGARVGVLPQPVSAGAAGSIRSIKDQLPQYATVCNNTERFGEQKPKVGMADYLLTRD